MRSHCNQLKIALSPLNIVAPSIMQLIEGTVFKSSIGIFTSKSLTNENFSFNSDYMKP